MYTNEEKIRNFMKGLTAIDIANSVHLYGIDFESCEFSEIINSVFSLFCEVNELRRMIENDFECKDDVKVLYPSTNQTQEVIIRDYHIKQQALTKILSCQELVDILRIKLKNCVNNNDNNYSEELVDDEEIEDATIREFLSTLTEQEIDDSMHLIDIDFKTCEIDKILDAVWSFYQDYYSLKSKKRDNLNINMEDYNCKTQIMNKLKSYSVLDELVIEHGMNDNLKKIGYRN